MYFVEEQHLASADLNGRFYDFSHLALACRYRREFKKLRAQRICVYARERRLSYARRTPKHKGKYMSLLDGLSQRLICSHQMRLPHKFFKRFWPYAYRKRFLHKAKHSDKSEE